MFLYALDEFGNPIHAIDAKSGVDYFCPLCKARMRVRHSIKGLVYFYAVEGHKSKDCRKEENKNAPARDPELLNVDVFRKAIMQTRKGKGGGGGGGGGGPTKDILPPVNLCQLQFSGALAMDPDTPIKGGVLSDLLLTYKSFSRFVAPHESLGFRVLKLAPQIALGRTIRFVGWWEEGEKKYRAFFDMRVDESIDFDALATALFHDVTYRQDRFVYDKPKYKTALVAGVWTAIEKTECGKTCVYCKDARTICVGMQRAILEKEKQVYCSDIPDNLHSSRSAMTKK